MTYNNHTNKIEIHYFFNDDTHTLDAFIRNKCESEFLLIVKEVLRTFDLDVKVETIAPLEGGLREIWKFLGDNSAQITTVCAIVAIFLSLRDTQDSELTALQKEHLKLQIKELKGNNHVPENDINQIVSMLNKNFKLIKNRSNFYEFISKEEKVNKISTSTMYENEFNKAISVVERKDFTKYIFHKDELPIEIIDDAEIEIVSPILKQGNYKWKGIYENENIDFYMKDKNFKRSIFEGDVSFSSGFNIKCILEIKKIITETGDVKVKSYSVSTVISKLVSSKNSIIEEKTSQGKKYLNNKKYLSQPNLFDTLVAEVETPN